MKELKIIKKAWTITVNNLVDLGYYDDFIIYADTRNEARSNGLIDLLGAGVEVQRSFYDDARDPVYTDVKASRNKSMDIIEIEGREMKRYEADDYLWCKERDKKAKQISDESPDAICVVWTGCYKSYWAKNRVGYVNDINFAGKYSAQEAYDIVKGSDRSRQEEVRVIDVAEYNRNIDSEINKLQEKIDRLISEKL